MADRKGGGGPKIIIVKKTGAKAESHGSSWKVAYADFVTAMMAFFLVLWILGLDANVKDMVQGYFNDPLGFSRTRSSGGGMLSPIGAGQSRAGSAGVASGGNVIWMVEEQVAIVARDFQLVRLEEAAAEIRRQLAGIPELETLRDRIEVALVEEGLRIELVESADGAAFFPLGSAALRPAAERALGVIAGELAKLGNRIVIEGHTDALAFVGSGYSNWELSADRANAARRAMAQHGLTADRFLEVRGFADRQLRVPENPADPTNRRVTILLPFMEFRLEQDRRRTGPVPYAGG